MFLNAEVAESAEYFSTKAVNPVVRLAVEGHDGENPNVEEPAAEFRADGGVMLRGLGVFLVGLGVERVRLHRPTIFRIRADVMCPGTGLTVPFSISARRRIAVSVHFCSIFGSSGPCAASVMRSSNSGNCPGGSLRVSSTICSSVNDMAGIKRECVAASIGGFVALARVADGAEGRRRTVHGVNPLIAIPRASSKQRVDPLV